MKQYIATAWLQCGDSIIRKQIWKEICRDKTEFLSLVQNDMMLMHNPEVGWHVSFGPVSEREP